MKLDNDHVKGIREVETVFINIKSVVNYVCTLIEDVIPAQKEKSKFILNQSVFFLTALVLLVVNKDRVWNPNELLISDSEFFLLIKFSAICFIFTILMLLIALYNIFDSYVFSKKMKNLIYPDFSNVKKDTDINEELTKQLKQSKNMIETINKKASVVKFQVKVVNFLNEISSWSWIAGVSSGLLIAFFILYEIK